MSFHAWYSAEMDKRHGHVVYLDDKGLEIKCTEVSDKPEQYSRWNDAIYVGTVETFVCNRQKFNLDNLDPYQLLKHCEDALALEAKCQAQIAATGNCFCFGCPIKRHAN